MLGVYLKHYSTNYSTIFPITKILTCQNDKSIGHFGAKAREERRGLDIRHQEGGTVVLKNSLFLEVALILLIYCQMGSLKCVSNIPRRELQGKITSVGKLDFEEHDLEVLYPFFYGVKVIVL